MKGAIATTETFKYILIFTLLFAAFLTLAITYNKVFKLKNETLSIIERYEGFSTTNDSIQIINSYLRNSGYTTKGKCKLGYGVSSLDDSDYEEVRENKRYYYCIESIKEDGKIYYNLEMFYKFNLPFVGELFTFSISGETKGIKYYSSSQQLKD